jgi:hypothetical protein
MQARQVHSRGLQLKATCQELQAVANEELPAGIAGLQEMKDVCAFDSNYQQFFNLLVRSRATRQRRFPWWPNMKRLVRGKLRSMLYSSL